MLLLSAAYDEVGDRVTPLTLYRWTTQSAVVELVVIIILERRRPLPHVCRVFPSNLLFRTSVSFYTPTSLTQHQTGCCDRPPTHAHPAGEPFRPVRATLAAASAAAASLIQTGRFLGEGGERGSTGQNHLPLRLPCPSRPSLTGLFQLTVRLDCGLRLVR